MQIPDAKARRVAGGEGLEREGQRPGSPPALEVGETAEGKRQREELAIERRRQSWANFWRAHWGAAASGPRH
jgi:hypothetical protein